MSFLRKALIVAAGAFLAVSASARGPFPSLALAARIGGNPLVGGPCAYTDHPGTATIVAITPNSTSAQPFPGMTVTFTFKADGPLPPVVASDESRTHRLTLTNGWNPGPRFLDKYGLRPGREIPCLLRLIRSGTCTPRIFAFPGIDLSDYFEAGK
ncbi:MAG: hypothetical protein GYA47_02705 [Desulfovibrio sp.]|nr:hypothetical protein [Desulfovibrio sp.]